MVNTCYYSDMERAQSSPESNLNAVEKDIAVLVGIRLIRNERQNKITDLKKVLDAQYGKDTVSSVALWHKLATSTMPKKVIEVPDDVKRQIVREILLFVKDYKQYLIDKNLWSET